MGRDGQKTPQNTQPIIRNFRVECKVPGLGKQLSVHSHETCTPAFWTPLGKTGKKGFKGLSTSTVEVIPKDVIASQKDGHCLGLPRIGTRETFSHVYTINCNSDEGK